MSGILWAEQKKRGFTDSESKPQLQIGDAQRIILYKYSLRQEIPSLRQKEESKCTMCSQHEETVDHIVSGCEVLAKTEFISRHDKAAACLHWNICQDHDIEVINKWYEHKPESVTHNTTKTAKSRSCGTCQSILTEL